jgi:hypothetical protein
MRFNTFNSVVAWYEQTKPVVSKHHTAADNIRPIGARNRKWERIRKVDDETYLLLDGYYGSTLFNNNGRGDAQYEQDMAPIMWKREADGDYIYVRNGVKGSVPFSRFQFLRWHLPINMGFGYNQQGKHWVRAKTANGYEDFPLPKTDYKWDYQLKEAGRDDGKRLKFRVNEDDTFTRVGEAFKVEVTTVDKELKKQWKASIDAFYTQAAALAPMIDTTWNGRHEYRQVISEWCKDNAQDAPPMYHGSIHQLPHGLVRQIVAQEDHPLRVPLMSLVIDDIGGKRVIENKDDLMKIRSAYNRLMNKALGMYETKEV